MDQITSLWITLYITFMCITLHHFTSLCTSFSSLFCGRALHWAMSVWAGIKQHFVSKLWSSTNYTRHQTLGIHFFVGFWIGVQILLPSLALSDKEHALEQGFCILNSELQYVGDQVRYGGANCPSKPAMKKKEKKWKAGSIFGVRLLAWNLLRATSQNAVSSLTCCETTYWESPSPDTDHKQCFYRILPEAQQTL